MKKIFIILNVVLLFSTNLFCSNLNEIIDKFIRFNNWNESKSQLEIYIKSNPTDPEAYKIYAAVLSQLNLYDEAIISCRNALNYEKQDDKKGELYYNLGFYYYSKGIKNIALEMFDMAINFNSGLDLPYYFKGLIYHESKESQKAIDSWKKYVSLTTNKEKRDKMAQVIALYEKMLSDEKAKLEEEMRKKKEMQDKLLNDIQNEDNDSKSLDADKKKQKDKSIEFEEIK